MRNGGSVSESLRTVTKAIAAIKLLLNATKLAQLVSPSGFKMRKTPINPNAPAAMIREEKLS